MSTPWGAEAVERALAASGADDTVVIASEGASLDVRWAGSSLTTNGVVRGRALTVAAVVGGSLGVASREGALDVDDVADLAARATAAAREAPAAPDARPLLTPDQAGTATTGWDAAAPEPDVADLGAFTPALAAVFDRARSEGWHLAGFAEQSRTATWLGTSAGVRLRHDQPDGHVAATGRTGEDGRSVWAARYARRLGDADVAGLGDELSRLMGWSANRRDLDPGRYDVVLPPTAVSDLLIYALWTMAGRAADEGRSAFSEPGGGTRIGQRLGVPGLTVASDPAAEGMDSAPFLITPAGGEEVSVFDNGMPVGRVDWVRDGVLERLADSRASGEPSGRGPTPPPGNLLVDAGGSGTLDEVVARTERGLLVTSLWYIREVDPQSLLLTGLTRDGVFLVEGGEVVAAVNNFRWNDSPVDLMDRIEDSGAPVQTVPREWGDWWTRAQCPPLRVAGFNMSSVSKAT